MKKKKYEVQNNETINDCLDRMKKDGYMPIKRTEKPVFEEIIENNESTYKVIGRQIIFEAILIDNN